MREIDPKIFGPGTWVVTHVLALLSDESGLKKDRKFYERYLFRMMHALPCGECRAHSVQYLDAHPLYNVESLFDWSVQFHNEVNARLKKPIITMEEAYEIYRNTELILSDSVKKTTCSINVGCEDAPLSGSEAEPEVLHSRIRSGVLTRRMVYKSPRVRR